MDWMEKATKWNGWVECKVFLFGYIHVKMILMNAFEYFRSKLFESVIYKIEKSFTMYIKIVEN